MKKCRICGGEIFGYGGSMRMPLCRHHYIKTIQIAGYFHNRESCPYDAADEEWEAVREIIEEGERGGGYAG